MPLLVGRKPTFDTGALLFSIELGRFGESIVAVGEDEVGRVRLRVEDSLTDGRPPGI
jgi:hypothetical protein